MLIICLLAASWYPPIPYVERQGIGHFSIRWNLHGKAVWRDQLLQERGLFPSHSKVGTGDEHTFPTTQGCEQKGCWAILSTTSDQKCCLKLSQVLNCWSHVYIIYINLQLLHIGAPTGIYWHHQGEPKKMSSVIEESTQNPMRTSFFFGATLVWIARVYKNPITLCIFCCANQSILFRVSSRRQTNSMSRKLDSILKVLFNPRFFRQDTCHRAINLAPNVYCWVHMFFKHIKHMGGNLNLNWTGHLDRTLNLSHNQNIPQLL